MSNDHIAKELKKIMTTQKYPENAALATAWVIAHFKGINIKIYDAKETSSLCDYNIVASAENIIQAKAMIDAMVRNLKDHKLDIISLEGMGEAEWILLDLGDVIIHIFQEITRDVFDLDSLWHDQIQLPIPQSFYFGSDEGQVAPKANSTANYF